MKKELINDDRLTPTMERIRNGKTQLFRERNPSDRTFINKENSDVTLEHKNKEMFSELIDGEWYWVSGCAECNGNERGHNSYIECEKHDVCSCCGISRKELNDSVWGGHKGWTCKPCMEAKELEIRRKAFEKLDGEEPDCYYTDEIICPHCGSEICKDEIRESQETECGVCGGEVEVEVEYILNYTTKIKGKRITE